MTFVKRRGYLLGLAEGTPESPPQRGRRGDARSAVWTATVLCGGYPLGSEIVSVPTERDDVLPDPGAPASSSLLFHRLRPVTVRIARTASVCRSPGSVSSTRNPGSSTRPPLPVHELFGK
jgi:hypothetical protein